MLPQISQSDLVGGFNPSEKYESVGIIIPNIWKTCSKPPTSDVYSKFNSFLLHLKMAKNLIFTGNPCCFNQKNLDSAWSHPCTARLHSCTAPCLIRWSYASPMASGCSEVSSVLLAQVIWLGDFHNIFWGCNTNQQVVETKIRRFILCLANIWLDNSKYNPNAWNFTNMYPNNCTHVGK